MARREMSERTVTVQRRVFKTVTVTKTIKQCERPYVLFGEFVRDRRKKLGLTQMELSERVEYSRATVANIETGRQRVLLDDVMRFAKVLGISPKTLFAACL